MNQHFANRISPHCRIVLSLLMASVLSSCASTSGSNTTEETTTDKRIEERQTDRFETYNRKVFAFNLVVDKWFFKPIAKSYDYVTPKPVKTGVSNFFGNVSEVPKIVNDILQWKWKQASNDTGRLLVNSTVGVVGIFDVAKKIGLPKKEEEDVGQTFGKWGLAQGPYIVWPFLGPSTVRDSLGLPFDIYLLDPVIYVDKVRVKNTLMGTRLIHQRAELLELEELASGDFYTFVRDAYLQRRSYLIRDGEIDTESDESFGIDDDF